MRDECVPEKRRSRACNNVEESRTRAHRSAEHGLAERTTMQVVQVCLGNDDQSAASWMATARPDGSAAQPQSARGIHLTAVLAAASVANQDSKILRM